VLELLRREGRRWEGGERYGLVRLGREREGFVVVVVDGLRGPSFEGRRVWCCDRYVPLEGHEEGLLALWLLLLVEVRQLVVVVL